MQRACYVTPLAWAEPRAFLVGRLLRRFAPGGALLDVGCGLGRRWEGFDTLGVDTSPEAVAFQRENGAHAVQGDACGLPVASVSQDVVLMLDVLEHLKDDRQGLREARRVLRERGALVVSVPLHPCLWSRHDEDMRHFRRYRPGEVSRLAGEAGFSVLYRTCWNAPGLVGAVVRKAGLGIEKATVAAGPFLWAESWVVSRIPSPAGLSEFVVAMPQKAVQAQRKTA